MKSDQYKQLIKTLPCGIANHRLVFDPTGKPVDYEFLETNHLFEKITGFSGEEIKKKKASEVLPSFFSCPFNWLPVLVEIALKGSIEEFETYSAKLQRHFKVIVFSPEKHYFTTLFLDITPTKINHDIPVCSSNQAKEPKPDCSGRIKRTEETCFFCLARDMTRHSDPVAIFSKIFEFSPAYLAITSLEGTIVDANRAFLAAMEYEKGEVIGKSIEELQVFQDSGKEQHLINQLISAGSARNFDLTVRTKTGKILHGIFSSEEMEIAGKPCFLTVMTDITDTKIANEALKDSEAGKAALLNSINDLVFVFDDKLVFQECYAPPGAFLMDSPENFIGKSFAEFGFPQPAYSICKNALDECLITGKPIRAEYYLEYEQNRYWYDLNISPYFNDRLKKIGLTCVARDVTDKKKVEKELEKAKKHAETASRAKSDFLAAMSHEIRTPLNGVIGFIELMKNTPLNGLQQRYLENITTSAYSLMDIISDILDFSKIEAGKMELDLVRTDLIDLMEQVINIIKLPALRKGLELFLNIGNDVPDFAIVDPVRLKQVLINLLSNAVKFTSEGEIELRVSFQRIGNNRGIITFAVGDTGIGISQQQQKKLFKAFSQGDSSISRKFGGTGLGLTISGLLVQKMGGKIELKSKPGKGSVFRFSCETKIEEKEKLLPKDYCRISKAIILTGHPKIEKMFVETFKITGSKVVSCNNLQAAIKESATSNAFSMIIADENFAGNGIDAINEIRRQHDYRDADAPNLFLYGQETIEITADCEKNGVILLPKPLKYRELYRHMGIINGEILPISTQTAACKVPFELDIRKNLNRLPVILLADDVRMNLMVCKAMLKALIPDAIIFEASNGKEVLTHLEHGIPDLILMDIQMPVMDGLRTTRRIRRNQKSHIPIIALTAGVMKEEQEKCLKAGMDDILPKPVELNHLRTILEKVFNQINTTGDAKQVIEINSLKDCRHFARKKLLNKIDNKGPALAELLNVVLRQYPLYIESLNHAIVGKEFNLLKEIAHKIRGSASTMCLDKLARIAENIENCVNVNNLHLIAEYYKDLSTEWEHLNIILRKHAKAATKEIF